MKVLEKIFDFLASIKLAVLIILSIGVLAAVGTFYEARFDAEVAQKLVYKSVYMYVVMGLLAINLIAVMIDRLPWRRHHTPFILAHVGILALLVGSLITQYFGIDGSMSFGIGESNSSVVVPETEFVVYSARSTQELTELSRKKVDFFLRPPGKVSYREEVSGEPLEVVDYYHYGIRQVEVVESDKPSDGPAIRIQLQNSKVNTTQWLVREPGRQQSEIKLGPARVVISETDFKYESGNILVLKPGSPRWAYQIYTASRGGLTKSGFFQEGDKIQTDWMGIEFTALRIFPRAREIVTYLRRDRPSAQTRPAALIRFQGQEQWLGLNSALKLYSNEGLIYVQFANRRIPVGFPLKLTRFDVGRYQGTSRASSYQSEVFTEQLGTITISMNEPLHLRHFTFYQASFESDEMGQPIASILSVNYDPGLWLKYLGSFLIVLGSILLFYFKSSFIKRRLPEAQ